MHVLYLHQYFVPPDGSGGTRSYEMARRFVAAGHRVTLITSTAMFPKHYRFDRPVTHLRLDGIEIRALRVSYANRMSHGKRVASFVKFAAGSAAEAVRVQRPDVIFATSTPLTIALPAIVARLRHRRPMVFEVRDLWPELPIAIGALRNPLAKLAAYALERLAYASSAEIVALSPGMKDGIARTGYPARRVTVVPNSCDIELFRSSVPDHDVALPFDPRARPVVTYAGTLGEINDVGYLVDIAASARRVAPELCFLIAGDGAMRDSVRHRATAAGVLGENLWMMPPVPKRSMPALFSRTTIAASLFADLPQMWNNSANKFFDALAAAKPVMINYGGWQAELLRKSGAGIVVPPRDPESAAKALRDFVARPDGIRSASSAAARLAETMFDRDRLARELLGVLERASGDRHSGRAVLAGERSHHRQ